MDSDTIQTDLEDTLRRISRLSARPEVPDSEVLGQIAGLLESFVSRHRADLSFGDFPLPTGTDDVLCSYELHCDPATGLTLRLQAIRAGVDSVVHDHGTWAVIVAIAGQEQNRVYRRTDDGSSAGHATLVLQDEAVVKPGQPLVLEQGLFHSIHTGADEPALQLHLYGRNPDTVAGRRIFDPQGRRFVYLGIGDAGG